MSHSAQIPMQKTFDSGKGVRESAIILFYYKYHTRGDCTKRARKGVTSSTPDPSQL